MSSWQDNAAQKPWQVDRRIPLALVFTMLLQGATVVWWASTMQAQNHYRDVRLNELEMLHSKNSDKQEQMLERLTRLETHSEAQVELLQRIEAQLNRRK